MMNVEKVLKTTFGFLIVLMGSFLLFSLMIPKAPSRLISDEKIEKKAMAVKNNLRLVAIGDSLTEGIGDETKRGGYVPLVVSALEEEFQMSIEVENFGVAGDRSTQILKRIKEQEEIQKNISTADLLTLTVGGNDLMKVIQNNILGLSAKTFEKPAKKYQQNLTKLLEEIRRLNPSAPIYVLGIYNPYYIYFPEITEMQTIVDQWNLHTQEIVEKADKMYFVPVNDLIYQGIFDEEEGTAIQGFSQVDSLDELRNDAIYEGDNFHPNYNGYQLIAKAFTNKMKETKSHWLLEG